MTVIGHKHKEAEESEAGEALIHCLYSHMRSGGGCFMLITVHFSAEQMGSFACIFQINPQFYLSHPSLKGSTMWSSLSPPKCDVLTSHTEAKHYSFNLFIICHTGSVHSPDSHVLI